MNDAISSQDSLRTWKTGLCPDVIITRYEMGGSFAEGLTIDQIKAVAKTSKDTPKARKLSQRQKESYVQQGIGARMACLGLMERVTDADARAAIMELGKLADKTIIEYGGVYFASFEQCVEKMEKA